MKPVNKWAKMFAVLTAAVAILLSCGGLIYADAASSSITVTSALTGEELYSGDNLQQAFDAAERGSIVSVSKYITLDSNVVLDAEVMLSGESYIKFGDYKIQLTGDGALFVYTRLRTKYIGARYSYSEVEMMEESGGYVYYLVTQAPSLEGKVPSVTVSGDLLGAALDEQSGIVYLDAAVNGISTGSFTKLITMTADNAEAVEYSFKNTASVNGKSCLANGCTVTASAANYDYAQTVTKSYTVILLGDVNGNGRVDSADASLIACHASGAASLTGNALLAADANRDGSVTAADAELICKKYVRRSSYTSPL